jgi:hypothetical protein
MEEVLGMATELDPAEPPAPLSPERIQEILEINETLDAITEKIVEVLKPTFEVLPDRQVRLALIRKLRQALNRIQEDVMKEGI